MPESSQATLIIHTHTNVYICVCTQVIFHTILGHQDSHWQHTLDLCWQLGHHDINELHRCLLLYAQLKASTLGAS